MILKAGASEARGMILKAMMFERQGAVLGDGEGGRR
jgi:hypothetical protein